MDLRAPLEDWDAQVRGLSPRFRCAALDLPGHGGSAMPPTVSIATMAEAVNTVKEQIVSHRAILIGHSMGCRVIMEAFQQSPNNIVGLVFVADLKRAPIRAGMTTPWMDLVASLVQKSEAKIIPGAGHFAMIEAAPAVNHEIQTFATHLAS
jgi:pimeloyl-ACP methyl ester carboxylesterase